MQALRPQGGEYNSPLAKYRLGTVTSSQRGQYLREEKKREREKVENIRNSLVARRAESTSKATDAVGSAPGLRT